MTTKLRATVERLCRVSREHYKDPYREIEWPAEVDREQWFTSPELISLYGTEAWEALDERQRKVLSFYEAVAFYSLNIHGERLLLEGLARRLHRAETEEYSAYLHHFVDEENKHMVWFSRFCTQYAGGPYPEKKIAFPRDHAEGEEDFLFFAKVLVFEEIVDVYNRRQAKDDRLVPVARDINRLHHFDETRHLGFGRELVETLWRRYAPRWSDDVRTRVEDTVRSSVGATLREYYNPAAYSDAGLEEPFQLRAMALAHEGQRESRREVSRGLVRFLNETGIAPGEVPV